MYDIEYCAQCRSILRASWMAQERAKNFGENITDLTLKPSSGSVFLIRLNDEVLFLKKENGRLLESKEIKQMIRDQFFPGVDLGHSDL